MSDTKLFPSTEIVGAMASNAMNADEAKAFTADPKAVLASKAKIDASNLNINVVQNSNTDVNLALPYYAMVEEMQAEMLKDESLQKISGGEILVTIGILCGIGGATATIAAIGGAAAVGGAATAGLIVLGAGIAGGVIGATVVAGVAGGVIAGVKENHKNGKK